MAGKKTKDAVAAVEDVDDEKKSADEAPDDIANVYDDKIEYKGDWTIIEFRGEKFSVLTAKSKWPTKAYQAFQKQLHADGVELLLGAKQWARFNQIAPSITDFWEFLPLFAYATGFVKTG